MDSEKFIELLEDCGYEPRSYSGRFMYGAKCVGIPLERDQPEIMVGAQLIDLAIDRGMDTGDVSYILERTKGDSLGMGSILYWPEMLWPKEEEDAAHPGE